MTEFFIHPDRRLPKLRPLDAMRRMKLLIADKEDTEQVFHIMEALNGPQAYRRFHKFVATEKGRAALKERRYLPTMLDDHETLLKLPEGSVGRTYVEFMRREKLTAAGLVEESEKFRRHLTQYDDDLQWFMKRMRDTHDLHHILTGYGRDALGEAALLSFTYGQQGGRGLVFISFMATREIKKQVPATAKVMDTFHEGRRNGRKADQIIQQDIESLLQESLEDARKRLNIQPPAAYQQALKVINENGNAYEVLSAAA